ncbi:MAG: DUF1552 domain-containing protein [Aureliella sp.]
MAIKSFRGRTLSRRTMLRNTITGLGAVTVGLPMLEEMAAAAGAATDIPMRAFNVFFGLGIPAPLQDEGYDGVLEPLKPLSDKLLIMRGVDQVRCDESGINAHFDGASGAFTAEPPSGEAKSGGPSIDQLVRRAHYPDGLPAGMVSTLVGGTFFRRSRVSRYVHSYSPDGTVAGTMQESPRDLFERVFGTVGANDDDLETRRLKRSVLDAVVDEYRFYTGKDSPLGATSRARVKDHLDRVREYEQRAFEMHVETAKAKQPPASKIKHGGIADPGGEGIDITLDELTTEWRLMADLYALAIEADRARFGALTFLAAGERIRLTGSYEYEGKKVFEFNDSAQHKSGGSKGCSHEWWHQFDPKKRNEQLRAHAHMKMREIAYFLRRLDETTESNGRTILENSMITISTESGDGRHNDVKRELSGVFHAISGAGGRFKTGQIQDVGHEGIDIYNTMLSAAGSPFKLGPANREGKVVEGILS